MTLSVYWMSKFKSYEKFQNDEFLITTHLFLSTVKNKGFLMFWIEDEIYKDE